MSLSLSGVAAGAALVFYSGGVAKFARSTSDSTPVKAYGAAFLAGAAMQGLQYAVLGYAIENKPVMKTIGDAANVLGNSFYNGAKFTWMAGELGLKTAKTIAHYAGYAAQSTADALSPVYAACSDFASWYITEPKLQFGNHLATEFVNDSEWLQPTAPNSTTNANDDAQEFQLDTEGVFNTKCVINFPSESI